MTVGKTSKKAPKAGGRGGKKVADPFLRKEWYDIKAPAVFSTRQIGKTVVNKTVGTKLASDSLKGRVVEVSLADLNKTGGEDTAWRKFRLRVEDVVGTDCLTNFYGMDMTSDKHRSLIRKWQSTIEAEVDVRTTDGYLLRVFTIGFTARRQNQIKKTTYAKSSQIHAIRRKMLDIVTRESVTCDMRELTNKFVAESISAQIVKETQGIFPLNNVFIRKVKVLKAPKFDAYKLMELHTEVKEDKGVKVDEKADDKAPTKGAAKGASSDKKKETPKPAAPQAPLIGENPVENKNAAKKK